MHSIRHPSVQASFKQQFGQNSQSLLFCPFMVASQHVPCRENLLGEAEDELRGENSISFPDVFDKTINFTDNGRMKSFFQQRPIEDSCDPTFRPHQSTSTTTEPRDHLTSEQQSQEQGGNEPARMHNLKVIAKNIFAVLQAGKPFSPKDVTSSLLETIALSDTSVQTRLHKSSLKSKRNDQEEKGMACLLKNVRRRLYDALNVMLAANIIQKNAGKLTLSKSQEKQCTSKPEDKEYLELNVKCQGISHRLEHKQRHLKFLKQKYLLIRKNVQRNTRQAKHHLKSGEPDKIEFPFIFLEVQQGSEIYLERDHFRVISKQPCVPSSDIDALEYLYLIGSDELQNWECRRMRCE